MAFRFIKIFVWYGFIIQFQQISCFRYSGFRTSEKGETNEFIKKFNFSSGDLQRDKRILMLTKNNYQFNENEVGNLKTLGKRKKRGIKHVNSLNRITSNHKKRSNITKHIKIPQVLDGDFDYDERFVESFEHPGRRPLLYFQLLNNNSTKLIPEVKHQRLVDVGLPENLPSTQIPQVPDDDIEDNGNTMSKENQIPEPPLRLPKSYRFFYRNSQKLLLRPQEQRKKHGQMEYNRNRSQDDADNVRETLETALYKEDALEHPNNVGPVFQDTMTWMNMMRAGRGWFSKGTHP